MKCIYCNTPLAAISYCPGCGQDVTLQKRIVRISNLLYNKGLEKASVRDLSGAIGCLKQSLKFNKENIDARNLLGLCYYEMGEVVLALCEWVISRNMKQEDNVAAQYIDALQNNKNQLDAINQSIRKYNQSIEYCRQGHDDMAIMQLRKVVSANPKLVKAKQLLALLYMKNGDYEKARRHLKKALAIDNANTTTLRYMSEVEGAKGKSPSFGRKKKEAPERGMQEETIRYVSGNETIIQPTTFRDSSAIATLINIGLGVLLGGAIVWFMVMPSSKQQVNDQANRQVTDAAMQQSSASAQLTDLQAQIETLNGQVESANQDKDSALKKADSYDALLSVANMFVAGQTNEAIEQMQNLQADTFEGNAKTLYDTLSASAAGALFTQYYSAGTAAYVARDYAGAADQLKKAVDADASGEQANYFDALYYLGFAYYNMGDSANADATFQTIMDKFPNRAGEVSPYLSTAGGQSQSGSASSGAATQGEASVNAADPSTSASGGDQADIQIIDDGTSTQGTTSYDPSQVAWTDPNTGLHYDVYGNLLG